MLNLTFNRTRERQDDKPAPKISPRNITGSRVNIPSGMNPAAKLSDLIDALEFDSDESTTRFDRQTGSIVRVVNSLLSAVEEGNEADDVDLPDWEKEEVDIARAIVADAGDRFIGVPDKFDFHEYRHMERFIRTVDDAEAAERLWRAIKGKGAFRYFKDTASRLKLLDKWYRYRDAAIKECVMEWAKVNEVPFVDDLRQDKS
jgi:hypothetical protein